MDFDWDDKPRVWRRALRAGKSYLDARIPWYQDADDLLAEALLETLQLHVLHPKLSHREKTHQFHLALDRVRKRGVRDTARRRRMQGGDTVARLSDPTTSLVAFELPILMRTVATSIFDTLGSAIDGLSDRDHDLVVRFYGLQPLHEPRAAAPILKPEAARKALYRAREKLREALKLELHERCLKAPAGSGERQVLEMAAVLVERRALSDLFGELTYYAV